MKQDVPTPAWAPIESLPADPFDSQDGEEPPVRTLVAVGGIQLGVVRSSRIRDEQALTEVLVKVGAELEKFSRESRGEGIAGMQRVLDGYRDELAHHMEGEVELRGPDWMIGADVGEPRPMSEDWRPRPY